MWSKVRTFLLLLVISCVWFGGFIAVSRNYSPPPLAIESQETKSVRQHLTKLAAEQRKRLDLDQYYGSSHEPGKVDVIVEFAQVSSLPARTIGIDGFIPKHVDITQGENGIESVYGVFTRKPPYAWPRTLDITLGPEYVERADFVEDYSSNELGFYRIRNNLNLDLKSPNGKFKWMVTKDKNLMMGPACLYRQDLYKDGEWIKSLVAIRNIEQE